MTPEQTRYTYSSLCSSCWPNQRETGRRKTKRRHIQGQERIVSGTHQPFPVMTPHTWRFDQNNDAHRYNPHLLKVACTTAQGTHNLNAGREKQDNHKTLRKSVQIRPAVWIIEIKNESKGSPSLCTHTTCGFQECAYVEQNSVFLLWAIENVVCAIRNPQVRRSLWMNAFVSMILDPPVRTVVALLPPRKHLPPPNTQDLLQPLSNPS
mmetsp:Transcript_3945/g.8934  ORF Transcript_3945/g.8934 Transcript_3945/m.8934 type:complete len:208 (-) Transcript_3945:1004-1627(-)